MVHDFARVAIRRLQHLEPTQPQGGGLRDVDHEGSHQLFPIRLRGHEIEVLIAGQSDADRLECRRRQDLRHEVPEVRLELLLERAGRVVAIDAASHALEVFDERRDRSPLALRLLVHRGLRSGGGRGDAVVEEHLWRPLLSKAFQCLDDLPFGARQVLRRWHTVELESIRRGLHVGHRGPEATAEDEDRDVALRRQRQVLGDGFLRRVRRGQGYVGPRAVPGDGPKDHPETQDGVEWQLGQRRGRQHPLLGDIRRRP